MKFATGRDDSVLIETTWPLPCEETGAVENTLRYGVVDRDTALAAAEIIAAYDALITEGSTTSQTQKLAALRRVYKRRP